MVSGSQRGGWLIMNPIVSHEPYVNSPTIASSSESQVVTRLSRSRIPVLDCNQSNRWELRVAQTLR